MTSQHDTQRLVMLDNWRGWAIIFVLLGHFTQLPGANLGRVGVELFFALSGRLMAELLFVKNITLGKFFYRRFTRVLPVSLLFVLTAYSASSTGILHISGKAAIASATMVVNFTQLIGISSAVTDHYWSLCVEEHSYIALALVALLLRSSGMSSGLRPAWLCLGIAGAMVLNGFRLWHQHPDYYAVYWRSDVRAATIFISVGLRVICVNGLPKRLQAAWIPLAAFVAGLILNWNHVPDPIKYSAGSLLIAISINTLDQTYAFTRKFLSSSLIGWVGLISYSIYIWQQPFFYSIDRFGAAPMLACAICAGAISFYLYENPLRSWLNARAPFNEKQKATAQKAA